MEAQQTNQAMCTSNDALRSYAYDDRGNLWELLGLTDSPGVVTARSALVRGQMLLHVSNFHPANKAGRDLLSAARADELMSTRSPF